MSSEPRERRSAKADISALWRQLRFVESFAGSSRWPAALLIALGLAASLIETMGIGLFVTLLYAVMGQPHEAASGGLLASVSAAINRLAGGSAVVTAALIFVLIAAKAAINVWYGSLTARSKSRILEHARNAIYAKYFSLPYGWLQRRDRGELITVLASDSWSVADAYFSFTRMATSLCAILVFGAVLCALSPLIFTFALLGSLTLSALMQTASAVVKRRAQAAVDANKKLTVQMVNALTAMRTIRAFAVEARVEAGYLRASAAVARAFTHLDLLYVRMSPLAELGQFALLALIAWIAAIAGTPLPAALAAMVLFYRLQPHLREFDNQRIKLAGLDPSLAAVAAVLDEPDLRQRTRRPRIVLSRPPREIRFHDVSFTYPGAEQPSLTHVSFAIPIGGTTAIIGPSGAGKTTILNLLCGLYEPSEGQILIDGCPLDDVERMSWMRRLAVAGQDIDLIDGRIRDNIAIAADDASDAQIERAATLAGLHDFVAALPKGYETMVGDRGLNLSGGQRQRVGLARALLRDADILVLDEATNALHRQLETSVLANIARAAQGRTLVMITHQASASLGADRVIELESGRVLREETPAKLSIA